MYADPTMFNGPDWRGNPRQRLQLSIGFATLVLAALISVLKVPVPVVVAPITELFVNIVESEPEVAEPPVEPVVEPQDVVEPAVPVAQPTTSVEPIEEEIPWIDLEQEVKETVEAMAAEEPGPTYSINPSFDERRRIAAEKFAPIPDHSPKPIWENVERDMTGRLVLRSGNCIKVLDDPNVGNRVKFEVFGQFMTECFSSQEKPKELPWVDEINARREGPSRYAHPSVE